MPPRRCGRAARRRRSRERTTPRTGSSRRFAWCTSEAGRQAGGPELERNRAGLEEIGPEVVLQDLGADVFVEEGADDSGQPGDAEEDEAGRAHALRAGAEAMDGEPGAEERAPEEREAEAEVALRERAHTGEGHRVE